MKSFRRKTNAIHPGESTELHDIELDAVNGGDSMLALLCKLMQMNHEMQKGVIQNFRA